MTVLFISLLSLLLSGCNGIIFNHYATRPNEPIDGTFGNKRFNSEDVKYTQGNLKYLKDRKKRNNKLYYASAEFYNLLSYNIANEYISNYQKYLKVDAKELEHGLQSKQYSIKGSEILSKMENGDLQVYPVKNNVVEMQRLKDEDDKIAFPDYMSDFLDVYVDDIKKENSNETKKIENKGKIMVALNKMSRDQYVDNYLGWYGGKTDNNKVRYKEAPLD